MGFESDCYGMAPPGSVVVTTVSPGGTLNKICKFSPSGVEVADSLLFDDGTRIGLGTITPTAKFQIYDSTNGLIVGNNTGSALVDTAAFGLGSTYAVFGFKNGTDANSSSNKLWDLREDSGAGLIQVWNSGSVVGAFSGKSGGASNRFYLKLDGGSYSFIVNASTGQINTPSMPTSNAGLVAGDQYIATAATILANGDKIVAIKV